MVEEKYLPLEEAAQRLGVQIKTVQKYLRLGTLKGLKQPASGQWLSVKEADIEKFMGKPITEPSKEDAVGNAELAKIENDIAIAKAKSELELANRRLDSFEKFDRLAVENRELAESNEAQRVANEKKDKELAERESAVVIAEGDAKQMLVNARDRIAKVDEEHKKAREAEDRARRERKSKELSLIDAMAEKVYNPPPQSISNRLQEGLIGLLESLMESYGLKPEFNERGTYIPFEMRAGWLGVQIGEKAREKPELSKNGVASNDIRACYKACVGVYNWMGREPIRGHHFCYGIGATAKQLRQLVRDKDDGGIEAERDVILSLFQRFHRAFMVYAESYQNAKDGDWGNIADWLCGRAQLLETKLGVGVVEGESDLPMRSP